MKIMTLNVNGIRSAAQKGFFTWLETQHFDVICLQEIRATPIQLTEAFYYPPGYHCYFFPAEKPGYSGVAIYTRHKPNQIIQGLGFSHADQEGRYLQIDFDQLSIVSLYLPSGSSSPDRQTVKMDFLQRYLSHLQNLLQQKRDYIICGDWNIAHKPIDLKNWRANQKNSGFLPEERAWLDTLFDELGFVDAFRLLNAEPEQYTWWSNRGRAWANNVGWRIDYQIITPALKSCVQAATIYKEQRFSDHAPLILSYQL